MVWLRNVAIQVQRLTSDILMLMEKASKKVRACLCLNRGNKHVNCNYENVKDDKSFQNP
jgi:hypothetical protein